MPDQLNPSPPYALLGRAIADARVQAGYAKQVDLALALAVSQQSISRWEAGTHRPISPQLDHIAKALGLKSADLKVMAGYVSPAGISFVKPLPVDKLDPEVFEQFTAVLVQDLEPDLRVRRAGKTGHTQGGVDVEATDGEGRRIMALQCKRVAQFGPAQVDAAVAAFQGEADKKILVLSRVASPQTTSQLNQHRGWDLWDKDDLTRLFRGLSAYRQDQIVDIFFRGQNLELLGRPGPGPWSEVDVFFQPFSQPDALFTHDWGLVGRDAEIEALVANMAEPAIPVTLLSAPGGMGKSRLLLEAAHRRRAVDPATRLWFLSTTSNVSHSDLVALGPGPKIVIVDDAHDRDALGLLFEFVGDRSNQTRLVLAARPYARQRLLREASVFGLTPAEVRLEHLNTEALTTLAGHMLSALGQSDAWASQIVAVAGGSPLILSMAARILSREPMPAERIRSQEGLRRFVLGKFADIVKGRLGSGGDDLARVKVLELLALVQPFHPEDRQLLELFESVQGVSPADAERIMGGLVEGGVALRRGAQHRLMPDVLGDYLIDESCVVGDRLSQFAQSVLSAAAPRLLGNIIINLGRLDWRRTDGDTADSRLLDDVWRSLESISSDHDERLDAVRTVSVFQPRQALRFVSHLLKRRVGLAMVPEILRNIAYTADYLPNAIALLWDLGRTDDRKTGPHPSHPMRVLAEMAGFEDGKPLEINDALLEFALDRAGRKEGWDGPYTPINLLEPFLATEGVKNRTTARGVSLSPFQLRYDVLEPYRARVVAALFALLERPEPLVARLAALAFNNVLRAPMGLMGSAPPPEALERYTAEMIGVLVQLEGVMRNGLNDITALALASAVSWHADHGSATKSPAQAVVAALPDTLAFRIRAALADGFGNLFLDRMDSEAWPKNLDDWMGATAAEIATAFPDATARLACIDAAMAELAEAGVELSSVHVLVQTLTSQDVAFARALIVNAEQWPEAPTAPFIPAAVQAIRKLDPEEGRSTILRWLDGDRQDLRRGAPLGFIDRFETLEDADLALIRAMLDDADPIVILGALRAIWAWRLEDPRLLLDLVFTARLDDPRVLDQVALIIGGQRGERLPLATKAQVDAFLLAAEPIPELDGHWINETISAFSTLHPRRTAAFFRARVERSMADPFGFRAANYGPWTRSGLGFDASSEGAEILQETWDWLRENWDRGFDFQHGATHLFEAMFLANTDRLVDFFDPLLATAAGTELSLISALLREAHYNFVLSREAFVIRFLERCAAVDPELADVARQRLYGGATSGMYSGSPGEPMPRDLKTLERTTSILHGLSPMSPAWELYNWIRNHAAGNIERSRKEGVMMDEA